MRKMDKTKLIFALLFIAFCLMIGSSACLPNPQSVDQKRKDFDRARISKYILSEMPNIKYPNKAIFEDKIQFLGYEAEKDEVAPGEWLQITLYYKVLKPVDRNFEIFLHLDGSARVNGDHYPVNGKYPTDAWQVGEIIRDVYKIRILPHITSRSLTINTGFYNGEDRMKIVNANEVQNDGTNRVRAGTIPVKLN